MEGTTLLLRDALVERLAASDCTRALAFVDACAVGFSDLIKARDVITDMDAGELGAFLASATYAALYLSCEPKQKSYPSKEHGHGIWTYFLLRALRGEDDAALGPGRYITDASLRDYLRVEVPRYLTNKTTFKGNQRPRALVTASNTFVIRHVPEKVSMIGPEGDLARVAPAVSQEYFERVESGPVRARCPASQKGGIGFPTRVNEVSSTGFVLGLLGPQIDEEIQELYESTKDAFGLKRRDIQRVSGDGQASLDTEAFRYWIESRLKSSDPSEYSIARRLELREDAGPLMEQLDAVFGSAFDKVVVKTTGFGLDYGDLVDFFEDVETAFGGTLKDEEHLDRITYTTSDGTVIRI